MLDDDNGGKRLFRPVKQTVKPVRNIDKKIVKLVIDTACECPSHWGPSAVLAAIKRKGGKGKGVTIDQVRTILDQFK